jgi:hypothetical protein
MYRNAPHNCSYNIVSVVSVQNLSDSQILFKMFYKTYFMPVINKLIILFIRFLAKYSMFFIFCTYRLEIILYWEVR